MRLFSYFVLDKSFDLRELHQGVSNLLNSAGHEGIIDFRNIKKQNNIQKENNNNNENYKNARLFGVTKHSLKRHHGTWCDIQDGNSKEKPTT